MKFLNHFYLKFDVHFWHFKSIHSEFSFHFIPDTINLKYRKRTKETLSTFQLKFCEHFRFSFCKQLLNSFIDSIFCINNLQGKFRERFKPFLFAIWCFLLNFLKVFFRTLFLHAEHSELYNMIREHIIVKYFK